MEVLLEVHDVDDIDKIMDLPDFIGVNNRIYKLLKPALIDPFHWLPIFQLKCHGLAKVAFTRCKQHMIFTQSDIDFC